MPNTPNIPPKTPIPKSRLVSFEAMLPIEHPQLLEGLDTWVQLGLISDQQVKRWARIHLKSERPIVLEIQPETRPTSIATGQFITDLEPARVTVSGDRSLISQIFLLSTPQRCDSKGDRIRKQNPILPDRIHILPLRGRQHSRRHHDQKHP